MLDCVFYGATLRSQWDVNQHVCSWVGVMCEPSQPSGEAAYVITKVMLAGQGTSSACPSTSGSVDCNVCAKSPNFAGLPSTVQVLDLSYRGVVGGLNSDSGLLFSQLPNIVELDLQGNSFTAPPSFEGLPTTLQRLDLHSNGMSSGSGGIRFVGLPASLLTLQLSQNHLSGSVDWAQLPAGLQTLDLSHNSYSGDVSFSTLPASLTTVDLSYNSFTTAGGSAGVVSVQTLPHLTYCGLEANSFSGSFAFTSLPSQLTYLDLRMNGFSNVISLASTGVSSTHWLYVMNNPWACPLPPQTDPAFALPTEDSYPTYCITSGGICVGVVIGGDGGVVVVYVVELSHMNTTT